MGVTIYLLSGMILQVVITRHSEIRFVKINGRPHLSTFRQVGHNSNLEACFSSAKTCKIGIRNLVWFCSHLMWVWVSPNWFSKQIEDDFARMAMMKPYINWHKQIDTWIHMKIHRFFIKVGHLKCFLPVVATERDTQIRPGCFLSCRNTEAAGFNISIVQFLRCFT